ncbi:LuxR C-terminal-related transcriptional regulator, partial [Arthrobacter sp.]|uniref:helix-turn-helix transcriptional regulator n=1 Tax=Arthrobacter sp. TaxID=1667 RepID=UPI0026E108B9
EHAALNAVTITRGVGNAVDSAVEGRRWPALMNLLLDQWADMFISNPAHLGAIAAKIPRFITGQTGYMLTGLRILNAAGKDGMVLHLPALKPEYSTDRTAQRLRADTERLYRKPTARGLTIGLLEISHLRLTGLYKDAGEAALRLREALHRAQDSQALNPSLGALVEIHSGLTLHLAARESEARSAYEAGFHLAQVSGKSFLLADVAGKLALLHALQGDGAIARQWLDKHEAVIGKVGWGRKMVARTAVMTRVYLAMCDLDLEAATNELGTLPPTPDNDELWSVHAYLLALSSLRKGLPASARLLVEALRRERAYASTAPLAAGLFDEALLMVSIFEGGVTPLEFKPVQADPALTALRHLQMGRHDAALAVLTDKARRMGARRWGRLSLYLDVAARNPDGPTPEAVAILRQLCSGSADLAEISYLRMIPGWVTVSDDLGLRPEERLRLETMVSSSAASHAGRPLLTPREYEILRQLRSGMTRRQIAESGFRSENTVKTQIRGLYRKLEAKDVVQALGNARNWGL